MDERIDAVLAVTAACIDNPTLWVEQLKIGGRLIAPLLKGERDSQDLTLLERGAKGVQTQTICEVLYVSLRGAYGL